MTIKHTGKNISAENEKIVKSISDNPNGILTIISKNFHNEEETTQEIDLSRHRLNLIEKSVSDFNSMTSDSTGFYTEERINENKSGIFLVPTQNSSEGIYEEFYWGEITNQNN